MHNRVLIFGGIGAGTTVAMAIVDANENGYKNFVFAGFINDKDNLKSIDGFPVMGGKADISRLVEEGFFFINTVYKIDGQIERVSLIDSLGIPDSRLAIFVHPKAYIAPNVHLSPGCAILPHANISSNVRLGKFVRVMAGAMVGHDCLVGDHSFFAANSCVGSHNIFGTASYFGLNCTVGGGVKIGEFSVIGMGSVVTKDVQPYEIVAGNPAKHMRFVKDRP